MTRCALTFLFCVCASFFLSAQPTVISPPDDPTAPVLSFDHVVYDFGTVKQGDTIIHEFRFTNVSKEPLVLHEVTMHCGCQNAEFPKEPIPPGKSGVIRTYLLTSGKMGAQDKVYTVKSNSTGSEVPLHMKGVIATYRTSDHGPVMTFKQSTFNFDTVAFNAVLEHKFYFVNTGDMPLIISSASQGEPWYPDFQKEPVTPGDSGYVTMHYRTSGHQGKFWKTITVQSNAINGDAQVGISGYISSGPDAPILKFDSTTYWFDTVYQSSTVDHEFRFTNRGKTPLIISNVTGSSGCIVPSYPKEPIAPGKSAFVRVVFNTTGRLGPQHKSVTVTSNASEPVIVLNIRGIVVLPPPDPNGPILTFDSRNYSFDTITEGDLVEHKFTFVNNGRAPLIITSAYFAGGGFTTEYTRGPVAPGDTGFIVARFNSIGKTGSQNKICTVYSNNNSGDVALNIKVFVRPKDDTDNH